MILRIRCYFIGGDPSHGKQLSMHQTDALLVCLRVFILLPCETIETAKAERNFMRTHHPELLHSDPTTQAVQRLRESPGIKKFFGDLGLSEANQVEILHLGLSLILQRAQGGESLSPAQRAGILHHLSEKTVLQMINHTGLTDIYILSRMHQE